MANTKAIPFIIQKLFPSLLHRLRLPHIPHTSVESDYIITLSILFPHHIL